MAYKRYFNNYHFNHFENILLKWFVIVLSKVIRTSIEKTLSTIPYVNFQKAIESGYNIAIGMDANCGSGDRNLVVGHKAGKLLAEGKGSDNLLIGSYTDVPDKDTNNFVNIENVLCFYRDTGKIVDCPQK